MTEDEEIMSIETGNELDIRVANEFMRGVLKNYSKYISAAWQVVKKLDEERTVNSKKDGKSVFANFVKNCDIALRPFDECLIIDDKDKLLAVDSCLLNRAEMLSFNVGMAAKTREHI